MDSQELAPDRVGERFVAALDDQDGEGHAVSNVRRLSGGASSITFGAHVQPIGRPAYDLVAKLAPPGREPVRNRDVLRQARILRHLEVVGGLPVPRVLVSDVGAPPEVPPFFAMNMLSGSDWVPGEGEQVVPSAVTARVLDAAGVLAGLHATPVQSVGAESNPLTDEVLRWSRSLSTVDLGAEALVARCESALLSQVPVMAAPTLVHGDYRLGNILYDGSSVSGVLDWEIWSLGDPRLDLAWLTLRLDPRHPGSWSGTPGMPSVPTIYAAYADRAGREPGEMAWFEAYVRYKQAATAALIGKHQLASNSEDPMLTQIAGWPLVLLEQCLGFFGG